MRIVVSIRHAQHELPCSYRPLYRRLVLAGAEAIREQEAVSALFAAPTPEACFAVFLPEAVFGKSIRLGRHSRLVLSTYSEHSAEQLLRACQALQGQETRVDDTLFLVRGVTLCAAEPAGSSDAVIRMMSPLILRRPGDADRPRMVAYQDDDLTERLRGAVGALLMGLKMDCSPAATLTIAPLPDAREVHTVHEGRVLRGSIGSFRLCGDPDLLALLHETGMGEMRGEGFGLFEWR